LAFLLYSCPQEITVEASNEERQIVLVLAGTRAIFEAYTWDEWGVVPAPGTHSVAAGRFRFVWVTSPEDARGYDQQTPYLLLTGWSDLSLGTLKAVLDRYETRFV